MNLNKKISCILSFVTLLTGFAVLMPSCCVINYQQSTTNTKTDEFDNNASSFFDGDVQGNISYSIEGSNLTILSSSNLNGNNLSFKPVVDIDGIKYNLIAIGNNAFENCKTISGNLTICEGIVSIGQNAFNRCTSLNGQIFLPKSLTTIGENAFCNTCFNSISIDPENKNFCLTTSFTNTDEINWVLVSGTNPIIDSVNKVVNGLAIGTIYLSDNVSDINGTTAFENCGNLNIIKFADESTTISDMPSFNNCTSLHQIFLPNYISNINNECFEGTSIDYISTDSKNNYYNFATNLGADAFVLIKNNNGNFLWNDNTVAVPGCAYGVVNLPSTITKISDYAFAYCTNIHNATFFNAPNLKSIGNYAFYKCESFGFEWDPYNLASVYFNSNLEYIGDYAFYGCSYVYNIYLPSSLKHLGNYAFNVNVNKNDEYLNNTINIQFDWDVDTLEAIIGSTTTEYTFGKNIFPLSTIIDNNQTFNILNPNFNIYVKKGTSNYYKNNKTKLGLICIDDVTGETTEINNKCIHEGNIPIDQKVFINSLALGLGLGLGIPLTIGIGTGLYLFWRYKKTK